MSFFLVLLQLICSVFLLIQACTNFIASPGATLSGAESLLAYNADSVTLYGSLYHYPATDHAPGTMRQIYDWDSGTYHGEIPEAPRTYNVVGNMNEFGVSIGETTYGGLAQLQTQSKAKIDYGSLIWITLQRSSSAREAIETMTSLVTQYGYASEGESFSIIDPKEAWILEMIGKGEYELGAVWVARKLPEGAICAHANQARITTFPLNDPDNCLYAPDTISFARKLGLYPLDAADEDFSFSDIYDPLTFSGARFCEARVWSMYSALLGDDFRVEFQDYALGLNLTKRMPLFVYPSADQRVDAHKVMKLMRDHYEATALDMAGLQFQDIGAYTNSIYRTHPLTWSSSVNSDSNTAATFLNERPIATPQTGWNFVSQSRSTLPRELAGLFWFGVDDSGTTVQFPIYGSATRVPAAFAGKGPQDGVVPPMMQFSLQSAFYVFNLVANWAYSRWDLIYPDLLTAIEDQANSLQQQVAAMEQQAVAVYQSDGAAAAVELVSAFSEKTGETLVQTWFTLFGNLFVKYRDGYVIKKQEDNTACGCNARGAGYPQPWYDRIVSDTGDHYLVREDSKLQGQHRAPSVNKLQLKALM